MSGYKISDDAEEDAEEDVEEDSHVSNVGWFRGLPDYWKATIPGYVVEIYLCWTACLFLTPAWWLPLVVFVFTFIIRLIFIYWFSSDDRMDAREAAWLVFMKLTSFGIMYIFILVGFEARCDWLYQKQAKSNIAPLMNFNETEIVCGNNVNPEGWLAETLVGAGWLNMLQVNVDPPDRLALIAETFFPFYIGYLVVNILYRMHRSSSKTKGGANNGANMLVVKDVIVDMFDIMNFMGMFFDGETFYALKYGNVFYGLSPQPDLYCYMLGTFCVCYMATAASVFFIAAGKHCKRWDALRSALLLELPMLVWRAWFWWLGFENVWRTLLVKNMWELINDLTMVFSGTRCLPDVVTSSIASVVDEFEDRERARKNMKSLKKKLKQARTRVVKQNDFFRHVLVDAFGEDKVNEKITKLFAASGANVPIDEVMFGRVYMECWTDEQEEAHTDDETEAETDDDDEENTENTNG